MNSAAKQTAGRVNAQLMHSGNNRFPLICNIICLNRISLRWRFKIKRFPEHWLALLRSNVPCGWTAIVSQSIHTNIQFYCECTGNDKPTAMKRRTKAHNKSFAKWNSNKTHSIILCHKFVFIFSFVAWNAKLFCVCLFCHAMPWHEYESLLFITTMTHDPLKIMDSVVRSRFAITNLLFFNHKSLGINIHRKAVTYRVVHENN